MKKAVLKNFAIFIGKHLRWSLFLIKLQTFRKIQLFSCDYCENFKKIYFEEHLQTAASRDNIQYLRSCQTSMTGSR